jgi:hypothetical protein
MAERHQLLEAKLEFFQWLYSYHNIFKHFVVVIKILREMSSRGDTVNLFLPVVKVQCLLHTLKLPYSFAIFSSIIEPSAHRHFPKKKKKSVLNLFLFSGL